MKGTVLGILLIGIIHNIYGQFAFNNIPFELKNPPSNPYKIIQKKAGVITKVEEFNNQNELVFQYKQGDIPPYYNWEEPHRFIYAFEFDENGNNFKRYDFNSNAGHDIFNYEFSKKGNVKTTYKRSLPEKEEDMNTNAYANISRLKSFNELKKSTEVTTILATKKIPQSIEYLNEHGKTIRINEYSNIYKDSITTIIEYDKNLRELRKTVATYSGQVQREVVYEYPKDNTEITTINYFRNGQKISKYQYAEVNDVAFGIKTEYSERNGKLNIRHHLYENGYLTKIIVFKTNFEKQLIVPISPNLRKVAEIEYSYNDQGLLAKEEMNNYESNETESRTYTYQIVD